MERRKVLVGSGAALATAVAGCLGSASEDTGEEHEEEEKESKDHKEEKKEEEEKEEKEDHENNEGNNDIPAFDREDFEIDSDVVKLKKLKYKNSKLNIAMMLTTNDRDVLAQELRALAPGFQNAINEENAERFFEAVEELKFTLYDKDGKKRVAFFLDVQWLRECLFGDLSNEEFVDMILDRIEALTGSQA